MIFEIIRIALGKQQALSHIPSEVEWNQLFDTATLQAVVGVCCIGIQKLLKEQRPSDDVYFQWIGVTANIQQQNELMDKRSAMVWRKLKVAGLDAVVLKGQGIAQEYGELASFRQSGDIDIWVKGGYQKVCDYVQQEAPTTDVAYHRFHFDVFKDTEVELHFRPTLMRNLFDDKKLARWYNSFGADRFILLENKGFAVPPPEFNRIFILTHIYRHFLFEGIGLRQVMDYYFVLHNSNGNEREQSLLRELRLTRFASAMMWILHTQFGLQENKLICGMNEKEGRFVLDEIMTTGNFGQADQRYRYKYMRKVRHKLEHGSHLLLHYPSEVLWTPVWLIYHRHWKQAHKKAIMKKYR